jgi:hypothetical protein
MRMKLAIEVRIGERGLNRLFKNQFRLPPLGVHPELISVFRDGRHVKRLDELSGM